MPKFPFCNRAKSCVPVEEATMKGLMPPVPFKANVAIGVVVPIPTFPENVAEFANVLVPVVEVAMIVPNVPIPASRFEPVVRVVEAPELVK